MVSIEYSPNARARCQSCRCQIASGAVRVVSKGAPVSRSSGYINKYTHAECYTNRKDLTQLYGFRDLAAEDQKRFMTEEQKKAAFPGDYVGDVIERAAAGPAGQAGPATLLSIVGLKWGEAKAVRGEKVTLVREPENQYDSNAIKVLNSAHRLIGRINKVSAAPISQKWDIVQSKGERLVAKGTILDGGDGFNQTVSVVFVKEAAPKTRKWDPEQTKANDAKNPYKKAKATPKVGRKVDAAPVTKSSGRRMCRRKANVGVYFTGESRKHSGSEVSK